MIIEDAYGERRFEKAIGKSGVGISRQKVRRLMTQEGLKTIQPKEFKPKTTDFTGTKAVPNLLASIKAEENAVGKSLSATSHTFGCAAVNSVS